MSNKAISKLLKLTADLLEIKGENPFKVTAYQRAARALETLGEPVEEYVRKGLLNQVQGIGSSTQKSVKEILETGTCSELDMLQQSVPAGVQQMLQIKGIGPKKIQFFWLQMGWENLGELYYACTENRLAQEKGFGVKTQENIRQSIAFFQSNEGKFLYGKILPYCELALEKLQQKLPGIQINFSGEIRRKSEIIHEVLLVVGSVEVMTECIGAIRSMFSVLDETTESSAFIFKDYDKGIKWKVLFTGNFQKTLFLTSSAPEHLEQLGVSPQTEIESETSFYLSKGLPFIVPELREGRNEVELARNNQLPVLIEESDIKGVVHAHSTYSDGANTLKDMALASQKMGYEYLLITDHSKTAFYANGLSEGRIEEQQREIDKLNLQLAPFKIFKGIESDILYDGSLDYEEDVLKSFDCIIASVHANLKMDETKANARLLKAIENPYTRILGHPTGRLLLSRNGYPVNHKMMIDACAANGVVIELNANPYRLDLDWRWIQYAMEKNVMISINPDAHSIEGIQDIRYGIAAARKGMLSSGYCLNAKSLAEFTQWVNKQ
ncbi:MAG: PHP domain-containing protein [Bacteroidia bacterium]|nr:PHP domain-containing protein [Bacteroidia bacterium]